MRYLILLLILAGCTTAQQRESDQGCMADSCIYERLTKAWPNMTQEEKDYSCFPLGRDYTGFSDSELCEEYSKEAETWNRLYGKGSR